MPRISADTDLALFAQGVEVRSIDWVPDDERQGRRGTSAQFGSLATPT